MKKTRVYNSKQGYRDDMPGIFFRSGWEANVARFLTFLIKHKEIYCWEFEPDTFWFNEIKRGTRSYLPDFKVWDKKDDKPYYIEVKGYMDSRSKTKIKRMAKYYPDIILRVIGKKEYKEIENKISKLIPNWE